MKLKDKLNDNELDLSLSELSDVPVKDILAIPKATEIDLSRNHLKTLPTSFATLTHITKLDLSKNELIELPQNFGNLTNLRYLDLYSNKLTTLPVGFCRLKNLHWLDLKDNPLDSQLKAVAGDCLVKEECQNCARKVVAYMQTIASNQEREKQRKLKEEREREAAAKAEQLRAAERERKLKKAEREKRKAEARERRLREQKEKLEDEKLPPEDIAGPELNGNVCRKPSQKKSRSWFGLTLLLSFLMAFFAVAAIHFYSGKKFDYISLSQTLSETWKLTTVHVNTWWKVILLQILRIKEMLILWTDHLISYWNNSL